MCFGFFRPGDGSPYLFFPGDDKLIHFGLFFVSAILQLLASRREWRWNLVQSVSITVVFGVALAFGTEWVQQFIPKRLSDFQDTAFDIGGVLSGSILYLLVEKRNQSRFK